MTAITSAFSPTKPISSAQGRYGELIIAQGGGVQPQRWTGADAATKAGIPAPTTQPAVTLNSTKRYYVARTDVHKPGSLYYSAPTVTYTAPVSPPTGFRTAAAKAYLNQSTVGEIRMTDGGKHYPDPPVVTLGDSHGKNAVLTPVMDGTPPDPTCINYYAVTDGPPYDDESDYPPIMRSQWGAWGYVDIPIENGTHTRTHSVHAYHNACGLGPDDPASYVIIPMTLVYTITGATSNTAVARINFYGQRITEASCGDTGPSVQYCLSCFVRSVTARAVGSGYDPDAPVVITMTNTIRALPMSGTIVVPVRILRIEGYPPGHAKNVGTPRFSIKSITVTNGGSGYVVAPDIKITSSSGFGAYATCTVSDGKISTVKVEAGGGGYKVLPDVTAVSGGAEVCAVARPHLRGKYQCYYRYVDSTDAAHGGPIPGNLSPVTEIDAGDGAQSIAWVVAGPPQDCRATTVELWRSTGDQAVMLYRVGIGTTLTDDLTDDELRNPDRDGYAAMPIVLPNGDLNAMRFGVPPNNKSTVVRYQDRFWYGVDTSGTEPNSIYFSEVDEPESVPDINEFVLQQNSRDGDAITALVPFGATMLVMQSRHLYSLSFSKQPLRDADVTPLAYRGCAGQRCWDVYDGLCYVLDKQGVYTVATNGEVKGISGPIDDIFRSHVDWSVATWNFVMVDPYRKVLRVFVALKEDVSTKYPTAALCYSIDTGAWWKERYPNEIRSGSVVTLPNGDRRCVVASQGGVYVLDSGIADSAYKSIAKITITNKGAGYRTPPTVTASGGCAAQLQAVINAEGNVSGIWILDPGYGYTAGSLTISAPDDPDCASPVQATATYTVVTGSMYPTYRYKSGNYSFPVDSGGKDATTSRDISVTYKPQSTACQLALRLYYNNSPYPRFNVAPRNRGAGFASSTIDAASRLDMAALNTKTGYDSGVAKASFANRTIDDMRSGDRHVAVEVLGAATGTTPVVIYGIDAYGTVAGGG